MPLFSYISILYTSTSLYLYISEPLHFYISVSLCLYIPWIAIRLTGTLRNALVYVLMKYFEDELAVWLDLKGNAAYLSTAITIREHLLVIIKNY